MGAWPRQIETESAGVALDELGTGGRDEIALRKGRQTAAAIIPLRPRSGMMGMGATRPDRQKRQARRW